MALLPELQQFEAILTVTKCDELHDFLRVPDATPSSNSGLRSLVLTFTILGRLEKLVGGNTCANGLYPILTHHGPRDITGLNWNQQCALICHPPNLVSQMGLQ
ncbi:hypothetical protein MVEG_04063 [Podila verticillata NRRL 6337]|nr:hypothetical protein MVEG_04063 [Podila verticillata NRRL 6337]